MNGLVDRVKAMEEKSEDSRSMGSNNSSNKADDT